MNGIINIYKEKGYTSHDAAAILRRQLKGAKVGHAGTLDPEAEGVLIMLIGKATKLSDYLMDKSKEYRAEITFGVVTDTYDGAGKTLRTSEPAFTEDMLKAVLSRFIGEQLQKPPMYSAIKVGGKKLYSLAREGREVDRPPRKILINDIKLVNFNGRDKAVIHVYCGKGTYIRSLCYDIGEALGCGAHMSALVREKSGEFGASGAVRISAIKTMSQEALQKIMLPMEEALTGFPKIVVKSSADNLLYNGGKINTGYLIYETKMNTGFAAVYDERNKLIGIYEIIRNEGAEILCIKPKTMLL